MKNTLQLTTALLSTFLTTNVFAILNEQTEQALVAANQYTQSIYVVNFLANKNIADPGMTPTAILVDYYNGDQKPCWSKRINYQEDDTIHAGPTQGCVNKVNRVVVTPMAVAEKLNIYQGPAEVAIDTTKYSTQITITQDKSPLFDTQNGLVATPGTIQIKTQSQLR